MEKCNHEFVCIDEHWECALCGIHYEDLPDESEVYGNDCPSGACDV